MPRPAAMPSRTLSSERRDALLAALEARFEEHPERHPGLTWSAVRARLDAAAPGTLWSLSEMERTGGEPDVVGRDDASGEIVFVDCSAQSPDGRRSLCYDEAALEARKKNKPEGSALAAAEAMGVEPLGEAEYRALQAVGAFDTTTSSWIVTPPAIRELGGALFCDRRYDTVFVYHNGAESYYAARGFRASLRV